MKKNILHKKLFVDLKQAAEKQASVWEKKIKATSNQSPATFVPDIRTRLVSWLIKYIGTENMHYILSAMKIRGMSVFTQYHSEHKHTGLNASSNLRAAVFGINDGLISNVSLILGIAGANANQHFIMLTGNCWIIGWRLLYGRGVNTFQCAHNVRYLNIKLP